MGKKLLILSLFILIFCPRSQSQSYAGKDFWLALIDLDGCIPLQPPLPNNPPAKPIFWYDTTELYLSSPYYAKVVVSIEAGKYGDNGIASDYHDTFYLVPNVTKYVFLPLAIMCRYEYSNEVVNNGIHVQSDTPIYVQSVNKFKKLKGASAVLPSSSIPYATEYIISTNEATQYFPCFQNVGWSPSTCSEFVIVGIAEVSRIEIFSNSGSLNKYTKPNKPITITLKKGETFFYIGTATLTSRIDLSGTAIRAKTVDSKFAVFAGNKVTTTSNKNRLNVSCSQTIDHTYEQLYPIVSWGKLYVAMPFRNNPGGYYLKILAAEPNTKIFVNGNYLSTLNSSQHITYNVNSDTVNSISADHPISVMQFSKAATCNEHPAPRSKHGNFSMIQLVSFDLACKQTMVNYVTHVKNTWGNSNAISAPEAFINVLTKTVDTSSFRMDGNKIAVSNWKSSSQALGYSYAQLDIDSNAHILSSNAGFISYTYIYAPSEGSAYTSGASVKILNNNFIYDMQCINDTTKYTAITSDSFKNIQWRIGLDPVLQSGKTIKYINKDTGYITISMYSTHVRTNKIDTVTKRSYITEANKTPVLCGDTLICGFIGFTLACRYLDWYKSYLWNGGHPFFAQYIKHPGLYWVKVTERNGCSYIDTAIIDNTPNPVANYHLSDTDICFNRNYNVQVANLSTSAVDSIVNTHWDFDDFNPIDTSLDTMYHLFPKTGQYLVKMRVTTNRNCYDDTFAVVEILKSPKADFDITNIDSCLNTNQITLINKTVIDSVQHHIYKWYFSEGYVLSNSDPVQPRNYDSAGLFSISLVYENFNLCIDTMTKYQRIYANPKAAFNLPYPVPCKGDSVHFATKTSSVSKPISSYWSFGDNTYSSKLNPVHFYKTTGSFNVKLRSVNPQGCKDSIIKPVLISAAVNATFTIDDSVQCERGNRFTFTNHSTSDTGAIQENHWQFGDGKSDTAFKPIAHTYANSGNQKVSLIVTNMFDCADTISKFVHVLNTPYALVNVNNPRQCEDNQNFNFTAITDIKNDSLSYSKWYYPSDSLINNKSLNNLQFPGSGVFKIRFKMRTIQGCENEILRSVSVNPKPDAAVFSPEKSQCRNGNSFLFFDQSNISSGYIKDYIWDFGDASTSTQKNPNAKHYLNNGNYKVLLTCISDSGCSDTASLFVSVSPSPTVNIQTILPVCLHDSSVFNVSATVPGGTVTYYEWLFGDNQTSNSKSSKHAYAAAGSYAVKIITKTNGNCVDTSIAAAPAIVLRLPIVDFKYSFLDGGNNNTLVKFTNLSSNFSKQFWNFGSYGKSIQNDTTLIFTDSVTFYASLKVTDQNGCSNTEEKIIFVTIPLTFFTPNAFTPNGDGHNDGFGPEGIDYATDYTFTIFNRWGEMVFKSTKPGEKWDGTYKDDLCPNGVYVYIIELRDFFGRFKNYKGTVLMKW